MQRMRVAVIAWVIAGLVACGDDGAPIDAAVDAPIDAVVIGPVQCRVTQDCIDIAPNTACFQSRPGGICTNCQNDGECPTGTRCIEGGTSAGRECAAPCDADDDCNAGAYCADIGYCQPRRCSDSMPCPYPYTFCRETTAPLFECARPRCMDGCPPPLVCPEGSFFCLEP